MNATHKDKPNPLIDLLVSIIIPSVILMKFSGEQDLGAVRGLIVALAFPLLWGLADLLRRKKLNFIAVLGIISILLTGGIGLLELDPQWLAVKEAAIPGLIGIAVLVSTRTRYPLIRTLLLNPSVVDLERVQQSLQTRGTHADFEARLTRATYILGGTFFFSAGMNYLLATWIVTSPAGSEAFNEELGRLTLLSYPIIALPSMLMLAGILFYLIKTIRGLTGLKLEEIFHQ